MRGYYLLLCRVQTMGLDPWMDAMDRFAEDGAEAVVLWMTGGFRSRRYPETWEYNRDHPNVRRDFVRELIDHAHARGIKILLGFSPFAYDGTNQYPLRHPETRGKSADGSPIGDGGIHCFGYSLCPAVEESQRFMLDYVEEMTDDFYPNADGLLIESTDYGRCQCERCATGYYDEEFRFVRTISERHWSKRPAATIVVYPHYFAEGDLTGGVGGKGGGKAFDPRWTLFFTPHSANPSAPEYRDFMTRSRQNLYWDTAPIWGDPAQIREGARYAREIGASYFPTFEGLAYLATRTEFDGDAFIEGRMLKPFGLEWLAEGESPYSDPLIRLNRLAYRTFCENPDLDDDSFRRIIRSEMFGPAAEPECVEDLLHLEKIILADRQGSFFFASPLVIPERLLMKAKAEGWPASRIAEYRAEGEGLRAMALRYSASGDPTEREMGRIADHIASRWESFQEDRGDGA